jgi:predicted outer membrane repeat protein
MGNAPEGLLLKNDSVMLQAGPARPEAQRATNLAGVAAAAEGAGYGGAMYLTGSLSATFIRDTGVSFKNNRAVAEGGAIHCAFCSSLYVADVTFEGNVAAAGGAICMDRVSISSLIKDNRFVGNVATCPGVSQTVGSSNAAASAAAAGAAAKGYTCGCGGGGALCIRSASSLELSGSTFLNNSGYAGGALLLHVHLYLHKCNGVDWAHLGF